MIHRHVWTVESMNAQLSPFEQMHKAAQEGMRPITPETKADERRVELRNLQPHDYEKPVIVTYRCSRCPAQKVVRV